jgi:hypothetical protein
VLILILWFSIHKTFAGLDEETYLDKAPNYEITKQENTS